MKKLLNTLYITTEDAYLSLDGENLVVLQGKKAIGRLPLHLLEGIVSFSYLGASPALMGKCAEMNISLCFHTPHGRFLSRIVGKEYGNVVLRKAQYRASDDLIQSKEIAKSFVYGKIFNARSVIERAIRDYPLRLDVQKLKNTSSFLRNSLTHVQIANDLDQLRGIEGEAASVYFRVFDDLILQQKNDFFFRNRNRRPPLDNVNALLSFVYSLLTNQISWAVTSVGLDTYVGFLHRDKPGRASLALDLLEEFRCVFADRFVLSLINTKVVRNEMFLKKEDGAVLLTDEGRGKVLEAWQQRKQDQITHPFLEEKLAWGMVPYAQSLLLARYLRGDMDAYPPFFWK